MVCDRIIPYSYPPGLVLSGRWVHRVQVHIVPLSMLICAGCTIPGFAGDAFGIWKVNPIRSVDPRPMTLIVRFEPHSKGEVFTLDTTDRLGRASTSSTILYFDGKPRDFQDLGCSGTQLSRRLDGTAVEIIRKCESGEWTRLVRRWSAQPKELVLEITEQQSDGRRFERHLVLEKHSDAGRTRSR